MNPIRFCKRGHEIAIIGRYKNGKCKECYRLWERNWTKNNRDKARAKSKKWYKNNPEKVAIMGRRQSWKKQGILNAACAPFSIEDYNNLYFIQNGACLICKIHQSNLKKKLAVDHSHITGIVRGLLCNRCNTQILPVIEHNYGLIGRAVSYLDENNLVKNLGAM